MRPASRENVAAHAEVLRGGEERQGPGGGARQEGAAVQTTGQSVVTVSPVSQSSSHQVLTLTLIRGVIES